MLPVRHEGYASPGLMFYQGQFLRLPAYMMQTRTTRTVPTSRSDGRVTFFTASLEMIILTLVCCRRTWIQAHKAKKGPCAKSPLIKSSEWRAGLLLSAL